MTGCLAVIPCASAVENVEYETCKETPKMKEGRFKYILRQPRFPTVKP